MLAGKRGTCKCVWSRNIFLYGLVSIDNYQSISNLKMILNSICLFVYLFICLECHILNSLTS